MNPPLVMEFTTPTFLQAIYIHSVFECRRVYSYPVGRHD
jgi:hypothetical protein